MEKISVIIPVEGACNHIDICLNSLIIQTFKDIEILCIYNELKTEHLKILERYAQFDKRIKVINHKGSYTDLKNKGIKNSDCDFVAFINPNDFVSPNKLEILLNLIKKNDGDFILSNYYKIDCLNGDIFPITNLDKNLLAAYLKNNSFFEKDVPPNFLNEINPFIWGKLYKKDFIEKVPFENGLIFEDIPHFLNCYFKAKISVCFDGYYYKRKLNNEKSEFDSIEIEEIFKLYNRLKEIFIKYGTFEKYQVQFIRKKVEDCFLKLSRTENKKEAFLKIKKELLADSKILCENESVSFIKNILMLDYNDYKKGVCTK